VPSFLHLASYAIWLADSKTAEGPTRFVLHALQQKPTCKAAALAFKYHPLYLSLSYLSFVVSLSSFLRLSLSLSLPLSLSLSLSLSLRPSLSHLSTSIMRTLPLQY
jgi:hypothetical protein